MDGHGMNGHLVSDAVRHILHKNVQECPEFNKDLKQALQKGFFRTNCELFQPGIDITMSGTTCVSCVIQGTMLYTANVGDSRAIMGRANGKGGWTSLSLSHDHKPDRPDEEKRILAADGRVGALKGPNGEALGPARVWRKDCDAPGLAMSRSLGDSLAASVGVIGEPEITITPLTPQDEFIVIASDGLWEFITNQEVVEVVSRFLDSRDPVGACDTLIEEANRRWKLEDDVVDDTTVVVIFLDVPRKGLGDKRR
ncbi:protein phosphatase 2c containing protein [Besnoitia besnoiti]|uniref:Protein phosphatase 2c containing protein n=1 Tax=Besnoitia besnoiti TaxID=94643 RepID=A0A2A9MJN8_BESBE|nr:protein phosphatase 2c containing protein [Besnoitia besnoiti]PFH38758.1 protein phosphatase 2c containing protein [Besnoitia besnoiti]